VVIAARAFSSSTQHHLSPLDDGAGICIPKYKDVSFDLAVLIAAGRRDLLILLLWLNDRLRMS